MRLNVDQHRREQAERKRALKERREADAKKKNRKPVAEGVTEEADDGAATAS